MRSPSLPRSITRIRSARRFVAAPTPESAPVHREDCERPRPACRIRASRMESWLFGALAVPTVYAAITLPGCVWRRLDWRSRSQSARANEISTLSTPTQDVRPRAPSLSRARTGSLAAAAVVGLTALGFGLRLATFDQSLFGDSSRRTGSSRSQPSDVLSSVRSNDEITPPLYFVLGWLSLKLAGPRMGPPASLIAGTATIPLVYLLGARLSIGPPGRSPRR